MYKEYLIGVFWFLFLGVSTCAFACNLQEYFPLMPGDGWIYLSDEGVDGQEYIVNIMQTTQNEEVRYLEKGQINFPYNTEGNSFWDLKWESDGLKIYRMFDIEDNRNEIFNTGELFLPLELQIGEQKDTVFGSVLLEDTDVIVNVPAGNFTDCIKLKISYEDGGYEYWWLAKDVGIVKKECHSDEGIEIDYLVSAKIGDNIIGQPPLCSNVPFSFVFSTVTPKGSSLIVNGIYVQGYSTTFWAKFDLNINNLDFYLDTQHYGIGSVNENSININEIPGLSLDEMVPYIWTCTTGFIEQGGVAIFIRATYNGKIYYIELTFDPQTYSLHIFHLWNEQKEMLF